MKIPEILFDNDDYIILNKPSGLLSIPDHYNNPNNLTDVLRRKLGEIFICHRIDKDTSGCIVFAKNADAHRFASMAFENKEVSKEYLAIAHGKLTEPTGTIEDKLMPHGSKQHLVIVHNKFGKEARTDYKVVEQFKDYALVSCIIKTGRMHQIRVHLENIGHPILCDPFYSKGKDFFVSSIKRRYNLKNDVERERPLNSRLCLHAHRILFTAENGEIIKAEGNLFKDMRATIQQLRKWNQ